MIGNLSARSFIGIFAIFLLGWLVGHWYYSPIKFEEIKESPIWITAVQHEYSYINRVSKSMDKNISEEVEALNNEMDRKENLDEFLANVLSIWELELDIAGDPYIAFAMAVNDAGKKALLGRVSSNKKAEEDILEKEDSERNDDETENNIELKNRRIRIKGKKIYILLDSESMCKRYIGIFKPYIKTAQYKEIFE